MPEYILNAFPPSMLRVTSLILNDEGMLTATFARPEIVCPLVGVRKVMGDDPLGGGGVGGVGAGAGAGVGPPAGGGAGDAPFATVTVTLAE